MVYCDQDMCESKLGRLMQAFRADRPSEWQIDEFIGMAENMHKEIELLRQAEKDASRYRWLRESASTEDHGGFAYSFRLVDAIRYMPGAAPNETMDIDAAIDEAIKCSK